MPYQEHVYCLQPENRNGYVWRFLSLPKFLEMLQSRGLYFARGDQFDDPYDGLPSDEHIEAVRGGAPNIGSVHRQVRMLHYLRAYTYINCWYLSEHESAAMWRLYGGAEAGIAIRSTYSRLQHAFRDVVEPVHVGLVQYGGDSLFGQLTRSSSLCTSAKALNTRTKCERS